MGRQTEGDKTAEALARIVGARARAGRAALDMSQTELASRLVLLLGRERVSRSMISELERGSVEPELSEIVALMFALGMTFAELVEPILGETEPLEIGSETLSVPELRKALAGQTKLRIDADGSVHIWSLEGEDVTVTPKTVEAKAAIPTPTIITTSEEGETS